MTTHNQMLARLLDIETALRQQSLYEIKTKRPQQLYKSIYSAMYRRNKFIWKFAVTEKSVIIKRINPKLSRAGV